MRTTIFYAAVLAVASAALLQGADDRPPAPGEAAGAEDIARLVADLGAERYDQREAAAQVLKRIGAPAIEALDKAAESDDPEVRTRALSILQDVRLGITPDWPADLALSVRHFDRLPKGEKRRETIRRIADAVGDGGVPFLVKCMGSTETDEADLALESLRRVGTQDAWKAAIALIAEPATVQQKRALAMAYLRVGETKEALKVLSSGGVDDGLRQQAMKEAVAGLLKLREDRKFAELAESAAVFAEVETREPRFLYLRADALEALEEDEPAAALRAQALQLNPDSESLHYTAGEMLMSLGSYRLAEKEWRKILEIPPKDDVYDINAWMRLGTVYEKSRLYAKAADAIEEGITLYAAAREAGRGMGLAGARAEDIEKQIEVFRGRAKRSPAAEDAAVCDAVGSSGIHFAIQAIYKDDRLDEFRRAVAGAVGRLDVKVEPAGVRIFDVAPITVHYDAEKKLISVVWNGKPCVEPVFFEGKAEKFRVLVRSLDGCYIYEFDPAGGDGMKVAAFEKDYRVHVRPGLKMAALTDVKIRIDGKERIWEELLAGTTLDYLSREFAVEIEGITPKGRQIRHNAKIPLSEPDALPPEFPSDKGEGD